MSRWFHAEDSSDASWSGPFETREACIQDGVDTYGTGFWINTGTLVSNGILDFLDIKNIIESLNQCAVDNDMADPDGDDAVELPDAQRAEAEAALVEWAAKFLRVNEWYSIDGKAERVEVEPQPNEGVA